MSSSPDNSRKRAKPCRTSTPKRKSDTNTVPDSLTSLGLTNVTWENMPSGQKRLAQEAQLTCDLETPYKPKFAGEEPKVLEPKKKKKLKSGTDDETRAKRHRPFDTKSTQPRSNVIELIKSDTMSKQRERMEVFTCIIKGRGVRALTAIEPGQFVCEYRGELVDDEREVKRRNEVYETEGKARCYMFDFVCSHKPRTPYWVDATAEDEESGMGRLINHSCQKPNLFPRVVMVDGVPRIAFFSGRRIEKGEELLYDYGERGKEAYIKFPWLRN